MAEKILNLAEIRKARADLDRLALERPELLGHSTPEEWEARLRAQENNTRQKQHIARRQAAGGRRFTVWLTAQKLERLRAVFPGPRGGIDWDSVADAALSARPRPDSR